MNLCLIPSDDLSIGNLAPMFLYFYLLSNQKIIYLFHIYRLQHLICYNEKLIYFYQSLKTVINLKQIQNKTLRRDSRIEG